MAIHLSTYLHGCFRGFHLSSIFLHISSIYQRFQRYLFQVDDDKPTLYIGNGCKNGDLFVCFFFQVVWTGILSLKLTCSPLKIEAWGDQYILFLRIRPIFCVIFQGHVPPKLGKHGQDRYFFERRQSSPLHMAFLYMGKLEVFHTYEWSEMGPNFTNW